MKDNHIASAPLMKAKDSGLKARIKTTFRMPTNPISAAPAEVYENQHVSEIVAAAGFLNGRIPSKGR